MKITKKRVVNFNLIDKQINFRRVLTNSRTNDRAKRSGATPRTQSTGTVPCCLNYIRKTYIIDVEKEEDYSTRDEHGRFTGSVPRGGGSGGGRQRSCYQCCRSDCQSCKSY